MIYWVWKQIRQARCDHDFIRLGAVDHYWEGSFEYTQENYLCQKCMKQERIKIR